MARVVELLGGRYEIGELIGSGGMGEVYRARDVRLERTVAVKLPSAALTGSARERFRQEAQSAARLNHPHVVTVYDWGDEGDEPYLVMEHVEGRSLRSILQEHGPLAPGEVARVGAQIADALAHAHAMGVVHRDVKPSNVLVTTVGTVKVTDFGIAQSVGGEALTEPGVVIGTAGYLAPEVVAGRRADARSDLYSLGVLLTELLTGTRDPDDDDRSDGTRHDEPGAPPVLRDVIRRARALDRTDRPSRASELRDDLRACARDTNSAAAIDPALVSPSPRTAAVVDVPTATVGALTGTVADPTKVIAPSPRAPASVAPGAVPATSAPVPVVEAVPTSTRRWRFPHIAWLVAAPVAIALAAAGVLAYRVLTRPPETTVPAVVGMNLFAGQDAMKRAGLDVQLVEEQDPAPAGVVLMVQPSAGHTLREGDTVTLHYSSTHAFMPDVIGEDEAAAAAALRRLGLVHIDPVDDYTDAAAPGTVTATQPDAHLAAAKSDPVTVQIARDPSVTVPRVVGIDEASARAELEQEGLVAVVQSGSSRTVATGLVISVAPGEGSGARRGDTVVLRVSTGPKLVTVPVVYRKSWTDAEHDLSGAGFAVDVQFAASAKRDAGRVTAQSPSGGQAPEGTTVTITVGRS